jgi:hypothetical protein
VKREKSVTACQRKKIMDDRTDWGEEEDDYPDDSEERGSAHESYLTSLKRHQASSPHILSIPSQDLNLCINELPAVQTGSDFQRNYFSFSLFFIGGTR